MMIRFFHVIYGFPDALKLQRLLSLLNISIGSGIFMRDPAVRILWFDKPFADFAFSNGTIKIFTPDHPVPQ